MYIILLYSIVLLVIATLIVSVLALFRLRRPAGPGIEEAVRDEFRITREETANQARNLREEVTNGQNNAGELLVKTMKTLGDDQKGILDGLTKATRDSAEATRNEITKLTERIADILQQSQSRLQSNLQEIQTANEDRFDKVRSSVHEQLRQMLEEQRKQMSDVVAALNTLTEANRQEQQKAREALDQKFFQIQASNEKKLDEMRQTVDEKLHSTLEKRLGESFKLVSERLEAVQRGLGEMKNLADGVGDLKRVLTNVKDRGTWGEYQLGAILEQILTPDQYAHNVRPQEGGETVEFAVKLPGKDSDSEQPVWLPLDAKFPKEDYERLLQAVENADPESAKAATSSLMATVRKSAKDINDKYIAPPSTTDFAIMFLPTEGLYAEILRQPGFHDELQSKYRVLAAGPTTLSAILNSLRVGFQTLAIEKRSHEVWKVLAAVKSEFGKFGDVLDKVKKQLNTASNTIDQTQLRTRAMERKLKSVEQLPAGEARDILSLPDEDDRDENNVNMREGEFEGT